MAKEEIIVDSVSGKTREQPHKDDALLAKALKEHNEDLEATYKVGQVLGTTEAEYEEKLDMLPPIIQGYTVIDGDTFAYFAMGEPIYHSDFRDPGRCGVAVATWYFRCSTPASWGRLNDGRPVRLSYAKERFFTVNETVSSQGRNRAIESIASAYRDGLAG